MNRIKFIFILIPFIGLMVISGCSKNSKPDVLIKKDKMTEILIDLYIADGLLQNNGVRNDFSSADSTENYIMVIEKHGYTMPEFEENIEYYFKFEPHKYEEIYDNVFAVLSGMLARNIQDSGIRNPGRKNLWEGKSSYRLPDDGTANPIEFSIPTEGLGKYLVRARITLFVDDQTLDPRSTVYFWYDDGTQEGNKDFWDTLYYEQSSRSVGLELSKELKDTNVTHLKGRLIDFTPQPGHWEMHSSISGINISFNPLVKTDTAFIDNR